MDRAYAGAAAEYDLASAAPRCGRHWRYVCSACGKPSHFMACAYDPAAGRFYCRHCAKGCQEVAGDFWAWQYYFRYRSPFSETWQPSLDRLEYEGLHPMQRSGHVFALDPCISREPYLVRYPSRPMQWRAEHLPSDEEVRENWNTNAARWHGEYDDDGDSTRRYGSDEMLLGLLGEVAGLRVLDVGSGNGYLCRKLAQSGAAMTGVELSGEFYRLASEQERREPLGIAYHNASATTMPFLGDGSIDKAVSNFVLMDIRDYEMALAEVYRVLKPGGVFVALFSHPCFMPGPAPAPTGRWHAPAPDSPRPEDRLAVLVDGYFDRGAMYSVWGPFSPVLGFHRPLRDYWHAFVDAGFAITDFDEPNISERGRRELSPGRIRQFQRVPYACVFQLTKPRG
jgi:SAM-dependent methyltransferase